MSLKSSALAVVRRFQSETDAIREAREPLVARMTLFALSGLIAILVVISFVAHIDRVVTSAQGKIVTKNELLNVFQALDTSLIKSIDVREGDQVKAGQLLATLDQTFANADVSQYKLQVANLEAQIARDQAELAGRPLKFEASNDPDVLKYQHLQQDYYDQHVAQYRAQINSYDAKVKQYQATIKKLEGDQRSYSERGDIATKVEAMRVELEKKGAGSLLNLYQSQDTRVELARQIENTRNSLVEANQSLESATADAEAFKQQMVESAQPRACEGPRRS